VAAGPALARRALAGAVLAVVVVALALPLGGVLPGATTRRPYDLRAAVAPAPKPLSQVSLLATFSATYDGPPQPVFSAKVAGANPQTLYWRLATYDRFDGSEWVSSAVFQRAGTRLPAGPHLAAPTRSIRAVVTPANLPGYLPAPDRPSAVSIDGLGVGNTDGELLLPAGMRLPASIDVSSSAPEPSPGQLVDATIPAGATNPGAPAFPVAVEGLARNLAAAARPYPFARLTALSDYLTAPGFVLHPPGNSPIGTGYYQVTQLLQTHDGGSEQYAAAFAVLARAMGFHARLAVGYTGGTVDTRTGTVTITTRNLRVWPEVDLSGLGWVPFPSDPAGQTAAGQAATLPSVSPLAQALQDQRQIDRATTGSASSPSRSGIPAPPVPPARSSALPWWAWLLIGVGAVGVLLVALVLLAKAARRRRQRHGRDPAALVAGAWERTLDRLAEHGLDIPGSLTAPEVAARAGVAFGTEAAGAVAVLVPVVDAARYNRRFPPTAERADRSWATARDVEAALRAAATPGRRLRAVVSVAPLVRGRGR
jgi:transglutaminase-like putative cysteine protease